MRHENFLFYVYVMNFSKKYEGMKKSFPYFRLSFCIPPFTTSVVIAAIPLHFKIVFLYPSLETPFEYINFLNFFFFFFLFYVSTFPLYDFNYYRDYQVAVRLLRIFLDGIFDQFSYIGRL